MVIVSDGRVEFTIGVMRNISANIVIKFANFIFV